MEFSKYLEFQGENLTLFDYFDESSGNESSCDGPTKAQKWGGAFIGATMVTSCALGSLCLIPCRNSMFYVKLSNVLVALAISTASGASFMQLAPSALGISEEEMTNAPVIIPATTMCLVFWYCLTMDKIKSFMKHKVEAIRKNSRQSRDSRLSMLADKING